MSDIMVTILAMIGSLVIMLGRRKGVRRLARREHEPRALMLATKAEDNEWCRTRFGFLHDPSLPEVGEPTDLGLEPLQRRIRSTRELGDKFSRCDVCDSILHVIVHHRDALRSMIDDDYRRPAPTMLPGPGMKRSG